MSNAANKAKSKWNAANYVQIKAFVKPEIASAFKSSCAAADISIASVLSQLMAEYTGELKQNSAKKPSDYSTRRKRRAAVKRILLEMEKIKAAEESLIDNAHDNLRSAPIYEAGEEWIAIMEDVIEQLKEIY